MLTFSGGWVYLRHKLIISVNSQNAYSRHFQFTSPQLLGTISIFQIFEAGSSLFYRQGVTV